MKKKCECGCRELVRPGKRFIYGHNRRGTHEGRTPSEETKKKISRTLMGHCVSEETKKKISRANRGKVISEETRKKNSDTQKKNGSERRKYWDKYHPYMAPYQYRRLKDAVKKRDHFRCVLCGSTKKKRQAIHHIIPVRVGYRSRLCDHPSNMITLCSSCHPKVEPNGGYSDKWKEFLPFAKKYLSQFGYKEMLLSRYLVKTSKVVL